MKFDYFQRLLIILLLFGLLILQCISNATSHHLYNFLVGMPTWELEGGDTVHLSTRYVHGFDPHIHLCYSSSRI